MFAFSTYAGLVLFFAALLLRSVTTNRYIRGRLLGSMVAFGTYALVAAARGHAGLPPALVEPIGLAGPLLLAFGTINAIVALAINPWRADRLPDRFPTIVQDAIVITLFAIPATVVLQQRVLAATAVGAIALGFALQDTLGNLIAGLAIQIEKPFRVGHWINFGGTDGLVSQITWRATKMRTKAGNFVVVPNSVLSRDTIINYAEPSLDVRFEVEVGASYDVPPNQVKATILAAIRDEPLIAKSPAPDVLLVDFGASALIYRTRVWTNDFPAGDRIQDRVRSAIYYAFRRSGIGIPYPIQIEIQKEDAPASTADPAAAERVLRQVSIFSALSDDERAELASTVKSNLFAAGDLVVRQDEQGSSMFVVARGEVAVTVGAANQEVAVIRPGGFFGEMSLLTGDPRTATVRTQVDSELIEITAEAFRRFVLANPSVVEQVSEAVATRRVELARHAAAGTASLSVETPHRFLDRVRRFLHLGPL
jgi:small-conductance mechanosensitive channel/CRP-like cAMP-binding protein